MGESIRVLGEYLHPSIFPQTFAGLRDHAEQFTQRLDEETFLGLASAVRPKPQITNADSSERVMHHTDPDLTPSRKCEHGGGQARMRVVHRLSKVKSESVQTAEGQDVEWVAGHVYELIECPVCGGVVLLRFYYHTGIAPEGDDLALLYPSATTMPDGMPPSIERS
jgi:hypothetical protein